LFNWFELHNFVGNMTHGSLFSGIGGFDLAAEWMGWQNLFHCEMNPFGQKVLNHYWPDAELFTDITKSDFTKYANRIDILTGGFPCQPYSHAGKRLGKEDDRHLWPEMLRAIREIQPTWVVGENVSGLISWDGGLVFNEVQTDLEAEGYEVQPFVLPAAGVGSCPHRRDRVWFIAYANSNHAGRKQPDNIKQQNSAGIGGRFQHEFTGNGINRITTNTPNIGHEPSGAAWAGRPRFENGNSGIIANSDSGKRCERGMHTTEPETTERHVSSCNARSYQRPTWDNFPTQPPVCGRNDGISAELVGITVSKHRNESIKAYGNAIVPQVTLQIFKAIKQLVLCNSNIER
jgi:DNA (cytosine-5)-methyltransferase 1